MEDYQKRQRELGASRLKLAQGIALALGASLKPQDSDDEARGECRHATLKLDGREIHLGFYDERGIEKIRITGSWPKEQDTTGGVRYVRPRDVGAIAYNAAEPEIGVSNAKGAEAIAKDMRRRFLPEFVRVYDAMVEKITGNEAAGREAMVAAQKLAAKHGAMREVKGDRQSATLYVNSWGTVRVDCYSKGKASVSFEQRLTGLTMAQAGKILAILNKE